MQHPWQALALAALLALTGCTADATVGAPSPTQQAPQQAAENVTYIDVRTPEEYRQGHVEGALNLDIQQEGFIDELGKLDKGRKYLVYCRSGNRSEQAVEIMRGLGFTDVANAGAYETLRDQ